MNGITKLYHSTKNILSQEFHYMKCQAFIPFSSSIMAQYPLRKEQNVVVK